MSLTLPADAGEPMSGNPIARSEVQCFQFPTATRQVSLRNTGTNTLWFSLDKKIWIDVACGTSWDDRVSIEQLWHCTQIGQTRFTVVGLALMDAS